MAKAKASKSKKPVIKATKKELKKPKAGTAKISKIAKTAKIEGLKKSAPGPYNFKETEESVLEFWKKNKVYETAKKNNKG